MPLSLIAPIWRLAQMKISAIATFAVLAALPASAEPRVGYVSGWSVTLLYANPTDEKGAWRQLTGHYPTKALCDLARQYIVKAPKDKTRCDYTDEIQTLPKGTKLWN